MKEIRKKRKFKIGKTAEAYVFLIPFLLGAAIFLVYPLFTTVKLSFGELSGGSSFDLHWREFSSFFDNYTKALLVDTTFVPVLLDEVKTMVIRTPLIMAFSLILAICISRNIKLRGFFRFSFFLPFLLGTGNVLQQMLNVGVDTQVLSLESVTIIPPYILSYLGDNVVEVVNMFFSNVVLVLWNSGVQILLFMSGIQSIPLSLYESASVDGATEWEKFWKITLPMLVPIILLNLVYTITESFTSTTNAMLTYIKMRAFSSNSDFEFASAASLLYMLVVLAFIGIAFLILGRNGMRDAREADVKK